MTINRLISAAHLYVQASNAFKAEGGEEFLADRQDLRDDFCHVEGSLSESQIEAIKNFFPQKPVQNEVLGRLSEWDRKIAGGLLTKASDCSLTPSEFLSKVKKLYEKHTGLLTGSAYSNFDEAKKSTREIYIRAYKSGVTVDEVNQALRSEGFDDEFIGRATKEWVWKAKEGA